MSPMESTTEQNKQSLYGKNDLVGWILSSWRTRFVQRHIRGRLVDLACGDNNLVKQYGNGIGVDIMSRTDANILVCPDFSNLPLDEGSADTISILASFNYFEDPISTLREIKRVLSRDGRLLLTMSNEPIMKIWHKYREPWAFKHGYSQKEITSMLEQSDFQIIKKHYFMLGVNCLYIAKATSNSN